jgi:uncharacterized protein YjbI with pentapeptide repeats
LNDFYIVSRFNASKVLWQGEAENVRDAVIKAIKESANLRYADLRYADLSEADLTSANLSDADLTSANLTSADLRSANLRYANLRYANLRSANLSEADLTSANLSDADLSEADLTSADLSSADLRYANLRYANLRSANLSDADLTSADLSEADLRYANLSSADLTSADLRYADLSDVKKDFIKIISTSNEVVYLWKALHEGKINGSTYEGECACLVGTIANSKGVHHESIKGLKPDSFRPAERWFLGIQTGDTPENNQVSAVVRDWIEEYCKNENITLPTMRVVWE